METATMRRLQILSISLVVCLTLGKQVQAQHDVPNPGPRPVIIKLSEGRGPPGTAIFVFGQNFGDDLEKVSATLGGQPCIVNEVLPTRISLLSDPQASQGKQQLVITVAGQKLNPVGYEVLDPDHLPADSMEKNTNKCKTSRRAEWEKQRRQILKIEKIESFESERGTEVVVIGSSTRLLDQTELWGTLKFGQQGIAASRVVLERGKFRGTFGPVTKKIFPGRYRVDLKFRFGKQIRLLRNAYQKTFKKQELQLIKALHSGDMVDLGDRSEWLPVRQRLAESYFRAVATINSSVDSFRDLYISTLRIVFKNGKSIDEGAWKAYLTNNKLYQNKAHLRRIKKFKVAIRGTHFNPEAWNAAVLNHVEKLSQSYDSIDRINRAYAATPWKNELTRLQACISAFINNALLRTRFLYSRYDGLEISQQFFDKCFEFPMLSMRSFSFSAIRNTASIVEKNITLQLKASTLKGNPIRRP